MLKGSHDSFCTLPLHTHFASMTSLGRMDHAPCSTVALKRDSCGSAVIQGCICRTGQYLDILLRPGTSPLLHPTPVGALAPLPQQSPEMQKSSEEEQAKAPGILKGHNAWCYCESQEATTIWVLQEKHSEIFRCCRV